MPRDNWVVNLFIVLFKSPFLILGYIARHRALLYLTIIVVIGIVAFRTFIGGDQEQITKVIPDYQQRAPSVTDAPYVVQTDSRIYFTSTYTRDDNFITLLNWYDYDRGEWWKMTKPLSLDLGTFRAVTINRR